MSNLGGQFLWLFENYILRDKIIVINNIIYNIVIYKIIYCYWIERNLGKLKNDRVSVIYGVYNRMVGRNYIVCV